MSTPDQRFALFPQRKLNRPPTSRIALLLTAPAFALAAIAATGGWSSSAAAQPVSQVNQAHSINAVAAARIMVSSADSDHFSDRDSDHDQDRATDRDHWTPKHIARQMLRKFGWSSRHQFRSLNRLWARESSWNVHAANPYSGAWGIPQAVPGSKMASAGPNWRSSARTQIRWGLRYIKSRYGSPAHAWAHESAYGWY